MKPTNEADRVERGIRFDMVIAVCALLISTLATGASWWQARVLQAQTQVLQEQLGAQVWPYVSASEGFNGDKADIRITNDGLGPAVLRSVAATVDGVPQSNFIDIVHAILGPDLVARSRRHGERSISLSMDSGLPGSVVRPGEAGVTYSFRSNLFAAAFERSSRRLDLRMCYCAIIPGKCWVNDSQSTGDPQPVAACPEIPNDLLHAKIVDELLNPNF